MKVLTPTLLLLGAVALVTGYYLSRSKKAHKAEEMKLTADELKTFNEQYRFKGDRSAMPSKFQPIGATSDKLRRTGLACVLAILASLAFLIVRGRFL